MEEGLRGRKGGDCVYCMQAGYLVKEVVVRRVEREGSNVCNADEK